MHTPVNPKFVYMSFNLTQDRALTLLSLMYTSLVTDRMCPNCGEHFTPDTLGYFREHISEWAKSHAESNYLHYMYARIESDPLAQLGLSTLKKDTIEETTLSIYNGLKASLADIQAPLN